MALLAGPERLTRARATAWLDRYLARTRVRGSSDPSLVEVAAQVVELQPVRGRLDALP